jgi:hypothetical protein
MKRSALLGVLLCAGTMALCQSKANPSLSQNAGAFSFSNDQLAVPGLSAIRIAGSCDGFSKDQKTTNAKADFDQLFRAPCANVSAHPTLVAKNDFSTLQLPRRLSPNGKFKFEPIPTQWPNAKFEQIPTQWPDMKMVPIGNQSPGLIAPGWKRR